MVLNETQEFIFSILDAQQDMTIKYTIFSIIIIYAVMLYIINIKIELNTIPKILFKFFSMIYVYTTMFFLPLYTIMLFREYQAIDLWTLLLQIYGIVFVVTALILIIFGWSKILNMVGIDIDIAQMIQDKPHKGENNE